VIILIIGFVILLLILSQGKIYEKYWYRNLSMNVKFSTKDAFEGDTVGLHEEIANNKFLPLPWVFVKYHISEHLVQQITEQMDGFEEDERVSVHGGLFSVMWYQIVRRRLSFNCGKRGFYRLRMIHITCSNLLHTKNYYNSGESYSELTVFPRILEDYDSLNIIYKNLDALVLSHSLINPDPFEFRGIRDYQPTDPMRDINFKASAIAQNLMVNIYMPTSAKRLEIILNLEPYSLYPDNELYEQGIRLAATLARHYILEDVKIGIYTNGKDVSTGENIRLPGGNSTAHLYSIYQSLARIASLYRAESIAPHLHSREDLAAVYLVISTYHGEDFIEAIETMKARGMTVMTVIPGYRGMDINMSGENVNFWEATEPRGRLG